MARPDRLPTLAFLVALVLAGCGGGDDGDPRAFAADADRACASLATAVRELEDGLVRTDAASEADGLGAAISRYATTVRRTADGLARARPPRNEAAFRTAAVTGLRAHARAMREAAREVHAGRTAGSLDDELRGGGLPAVPATLLADAPACRRTAR